MASFRQTTVTNPILKYLVEVTMSGLLN